VAFDYNKKIAISFTLRFACFQIISVVVEERRDANNDIAVFESNKRSSKHGFKRINVEICVVLLSLLLLKLYCI
jgi:hypothetical protein